MPISPGWPPPRGQKYVDSNIALLSSNPLIDVSKDGGKSWETARLGRSGEPKALSRFYFDFHWNGGEMLLQSRAIDDTGYIQPTKAMLRDVRGLNSIYHNNGIQTWHVAQNGEVENVEVSQNSYSRDRFMYAIRLINGRKIRTWASGFT